MLTQLNLFQCRTEEDEDGDDKKENKFLQNNNRMFDCNDEMMISLSFYQSRMRKKGELNWSINEQKRVCL